MKRLFLTSSIGTSGVATSIVAKLKDLTGFRTAFITTPVEPTSEASDLSWLQVDRKAMVDAGFDLLDYTITGKNIDQIKQDLSDIDIIYMSGGNTNYLLEQSQKSGFIGFIRDYVAQGNPYISTSAGSIIAGQQLPPYLWDDHHMVPNLRDYMCFNLVDFTVVPHWGSRWFNELYLNGRMDQIYSNSESYVLLNDNEYVEVKDDNFRIVDVRREL